MIIEKYITEKRDRSLRLNRVADNDYRVSLSSDHRTETIKRFFYLTAAQNYIRKAARTFGLLEDWTY